MSAYIRTPFKSGVTGVARVTTYTKCPKSLACTPVTRLRSCSYTGCNPAQTCNARTSPRPLRADLHRSSAKGLSLVTLPKYRARDQALHTMREMLNNDS